MPGRAAQAAKGGKILPVGGNARQSFYGRCAASHGAAGATKPLCVDNGAIWPGPCNTGAMPNAKLIIQFIDPLAIAIVLGGTFVATALRGPLSDTGAAFAALRRLTGTPFDAQDARARIVKAERIAKGNLVAVDAAILADPDIAAAVEAIGDGASAEAVDALLAARAAQRAERHAVVHDFWQAASEAAPAMGMIGTLLGLVRMFRGMEDPATIGGAMAVALLATLYGALFANLVFAPIAARLRRQSRREEIARRRLRAPLMALARRYAAPPRRRESA